ncbi:hypothetical protein BJY00DRAFT_43542 [Aspergillus carlsbadensis]|nr:hypothetical protein BJY00DRAFT_43542 [Aspergillus carlsbadensis]
MRTGVRAWTGANAGQMMFLIVASHLISSRLMFVEPRCRMVLSALTLSSLSRTSEVGRGTRLGSPGPCSEHRSEDHPRRESETLIFKTPIKGPITLQYLARSLETHIQEAKGHF